MSTELDNFEGGADSVDEPSPANLGALLDHYRPRLERMIAVRLDPRLRRRVDPADVLQETFIAVTRRLDEYLAQRPMPFFLWVRVLTGQKLADIHRSHLRAAQRDAGREITPRGVPPVSTVSLADLFVDPGRSPSKTAARLEAFEQIRQALEELDEVDREVLALRYFEGLTNQETAEVLALSPSAAKRRHVRALRRIRAVLPEERDVPTP